MPLANPYDVPEFDLEWRRSTFPMDDDDVDVYCRLCGNCDHTYVDEDGQPRCFTHPEARG